MTKIGVDIIQPIVPHYRIPLFEKLSRQPEFDLSVQVSEAAVNGNPTLPLQIENYLVCPPEKRFGPFIVQSGLSLVKACSPGDVLVVCGDVHYFSNFKLIYQARRKKVGVLWWGHHRSAFASDWKVAMRLSLVRRIADAVLCYTDSGIHYLEQRGFPMGRVFATGNTIDTNAILHEKQKWSDAAIHSFKVEQALIDRKFILFCGRLTEKTKLDVMIEALAELLKHDKNYILVIIGEGSLRKPCETLVHKFGVASNVRWVGSLTNQADLAPYFLSADLFVYPGAIGLSLLHAFAYGLPVITHDNILNQMPEIEILQNGVNGATYKQGDVHSLASVVETMMSDRIHLKKMGQTASSNVGEKYTMDRMVARFKEAIIGCSNLVRERYSL